MKSQKYVCGSLRYDFAFFRTDANVLLSKRDYLRSKCWDRNKFTLKCFKDR